ncbi:PREDICTED: syndecan-4 [Elephantulus edwardii]|uniref:syndecan-4 n=1 Tax=Elephantulus edwardii TaxID=28737 RepID=UPI0003F08828|nr:PREDICTED: syndecan-4 [Elephantulus edwardii]
MKMLGEPGGEGGSLGMRTHESSLPSCPAEVEEGMAGWTHPLSPEARIRETEVINPLDLETQYFSGALPDDEDVGGPGQEPDDFEMSGSGDLDDSEDPRIAPKVILPLVPIDNNIPERTGPVNRVPTDTKELEDNEVIPKRISPFDGDEDVSNRVSMSSTGQGRGIFERTDVLAALIVGGVVCILFATFLILLLVYRMKKKDEGSYDLGKKPIYKKAPTNEFYA